jgi:uncharacterized membrane protein YukC
MDWNTFWFVVIIAVLVIALILVIAWYFSLRKKRKEMPSHVELYFDENFRGIMSEWDMVTRDRVKSFKKDIGGRLAKVGSDIDEMEKTKKKLESRMSSLDREMSKLENF